MTSAGGPMVPSLLASIALLLVTLGIFIRLLLPRDVRHKLVADLIHDGVRGLWRLVFGPRRVRVVDHRRRSVTRERGPKRRARGSGPRE